MIVYLVVAMWFSVAYPFPSLFDELAHLSVVRAQFDHPDLFADTRHYMMLRSDDLSRWSVQGNVLNHPPLYYLGLAPLLSIDGSVIAMRLVNVALSTGALIIAIASGWRIFKSVAERAAFAFIAACFPKAAMIGGMINNDNLAAVAAAIVFAGLAGGPAWIIAAGLALAGWTKLTALIALSVAVCVKALLDREQGLWRQANILALLGAAVGAMPYLVSFVRSGQLFHVNAAIYASAPGTKPAWSFADYTGVFFSELIGKWPAAEASLPLWFGALLIAAPVILALLGSVVDIRARRIGIAYVAATAVTLALHFAFGWQSFQAIGDLTIAQTRYYNVLWPGLALAGTSAVVRLGHARLLAFAAYLVPTVIGGTILALV